MFLGTVCSILKYFLLLAVGFRNNDSQFCEKLTDLRDYPSNWPLLIRFCCWHRTCKYELSERRTSFKIYLKKLYMRNEKSLAFD